MRDARRSVSDQDLMKYGAFAQSLQQQRAAIGSGGTSINNFSFPSSANAGGGVADADDDDDDDLYS